MASVRAAFTRLRIHSDIANRPEEAEGADAIVLPGVGAFGAGVQALKQGNWIEFLQDRFANDEPTLAICLGMQLLCLSSEEDSSKTGLGILPVGVRKFPSTVRVPQFGWNQVNSTGNWQSGFAYFANSYCLDDSQTLVNQGWDVLTAEYELNFVAAARKGRWMACQFHPELSGRFGLQLLESWLSRSITNSSEERFKDSIEC